MLFKKLFSKKESAPKTKEAPQPVNPAVKPETKADERECPDCGKTNQNTDPKETNTANNSQNNIPAFLLYPEDPLSKMMFKKT